MLIYLKQIDYLRIAFIADDNEIRTRSGRRVKRRSDEIKHSKSKKSDFDSDVGEESDNEYKPASSYNKRFESSDEEQEVVTRKPDTRLRRALRERKTTVKYSCDQENDENEFDDDIYDKEN